MDYDSPTNTSLNILLIEDEFVDQESVMRILTQADPNFRVKVRTYLQAGIDVLREENIHVLLLDLSLPDSYGVDTIKRLLEEFPSVPIIVLTGAADEELAREAVALGVESYLVKGSATGAEILEATLLATS